jgi:hypothetical protein
LPQIYNLLSRLAKEERRTKSAEVEMALLAYAQAKEKR